MIWERGLNAEVWWKCEFFLSLKIPYEYLWENNLYISAWWGDGAWRWEQSHPALHWEGKLRAPPRGWLVGLPGTNNPARGGRSTPTVHPCSSGAPAEPDCLRGGLLFLCPLAKLYLRGSEILLTGFHPIISPCERHHYLSHLTTRHHGSKDTIPFQICWN